MNLLVKGALVGILIAHICTYKEYYIKTLTTLSATYILKRILRSVGSKDQADLLGLGGYSLTAASIFALIKAMNDKYLN